MNAALRAPSLSKLTPEPEGVVELVAEGETGDSEEAKLDRPSATAKLLGTILESTIVEESSELLLCRPAVSEEFWIQG